MPISQHRYTQSLWPYYSAYLALSAIAVYGMRLGSSSQLTAKYLEPLSNSVPSFAYPGRPDVTIRRHYTGIVPLDVLLSILVTAFLAGPAKFYSHIKVQQAYFLFTFAPVITVFSIEAVRVRKWSPIIFTSLWAILYQTIGGAVVIPFYFIAHTFAFRKGGSAQKIPAKWANTLLPAVVLGYILPTALMYYPFTDIQHTMLAIAFWQPSPIYLNILWTAFGLIASAKGASHIKASLSLVTLLAAASHIITLYLCFLPSRPDISLTSIFLPIERTAFAEATHYIFQVDYLVIFAATTIWSIQTIGKEKSQVRVSDVVLVLISVAVIGPGATLSGLWYRRGIE